MINRLFKFQRRAFEDLDTSLKKYKQVIHRALVGNELLYRAVATGFKTQLDGYRDILEELSEAVISCDKKVPLNELRKKHNDLQTIINNKIEADPQVNKIDSCPVLETNPHYSLDLKEKKNNKGSLLKPLFDANKELFEAIADKANEPITSVSLSLEKLPESPMCLSG